MQACDSYLLSFAIFSGDIFMIRLTALELRNFKNIEFGRISLSSSSDEDASQSDIIGIYGQNGSGKTSVITALKILKELWEGSLLSRDTIKDCIAAKKTSLEIVCEGFITASSDLKQTWVYSVGITYDDDLAKCFVSAERLSCLRVFANKPTMATLFDYRCDLRGDCTIGPKTFWGSLPTLEKNLDTQLSIAQALSHMQGTSLLFSDVLTERFQKLHYLFEDAEAGKLSKKACELIASYLTYICRVQSALFRFALRHMVVLLPSAQAFYYLNLFPIYSHEGKGGHFSDSYIRVNLSSPMVLPDDEVLELDHTVGTINGVLSALVPGLSIAVIKMGTEMQDDGTPAQRLELVATRDGVTVPLRCESEGIKRLVSVLTLLIDVYADSDACVAIDELDSGIFEYLLGEIIQVLEKHGKGQLIFTAHNLRPLEVISKKSIVFTTTNPKNRYIPFKGLKTTNNFRDQYLRSLVLGGQSEEVYLPTNEYTIDGAFYEAGSALSDEG